MSREGSSAVEAAGPSRVDPFGVWVWLVVATVCFTCAGVVWFQARQAERLEGGYAAVRLLRQSRLDLTKGFLNVALAGSPGAPFSREQGLALIDQAVGRLRDGLGEEETVALANLLKAAEALRAGVRERSEEAVADGGYLADLRAKFGVLEREADAVDGRLREGLANLMLAQRHGFWGVAAGAVTIVGVACGALLVLRRRGRRAANEAEDLAERFAAVVEHLPIGLIMTGSGGHGVRLNPAARDILGEAGAGRADHVEYLGADGAVLEEGRRPLARVEGGETLRELEIRVRPGGGGGERILSFSGARVVGPRDAAFAFLAVRDVTKRRQDEEELRSLNAELERRVAERTAALEGKNRELETFTYSVSHDLKAPLRGIDGYSRLLLDEHGDGLNEEGRLFLRRVRQASEHMGQLIDDLLTYSRLERRAVRLGSVALAKVVMAQVAVFEAEANERGVNVVVQVAEDLEVTADMQGLIMVMRNLLDNAFKFTRGRIGARIEVGGRVREDGGVSAWVRDNGVGFEGRYAEKMFEIFQRLHRAEDYPGTGIGLAIVRKAMERMGGTVRAEGKVGEGAAFFLEFGGAARGRVSGGAD